MLQGSARCWRLKESRKILDESELRVLRLKQVPYFIGGLATQINVEHFSVVVRAVSEPQCQLRHGGFAGHIADELCLLFHLRHDYLFHFGHFALTVNVCHLLPAVGIANAFE